MDYDFGADDILLKDEKAIMVANARANSGQAVPITV